MTSVLQQFIAQVESSGVSDSLLVQLCGESRSSKYALGIIANSNANLPFVATTVKTWQMENALQHITASATWKNISFLVPSLPSVNSTWANNRRRWWQQQMLLVHCIHEPLARLSRLPLGIHALLWLLSVVFQLPTSPIQPKSYSMHNSRSGRTCLLLIRHAARLCTTA